MREGIHIHSNHAEAQLIGWIYPKLQEAEIACVVLAVTLCPCSGCTVDPAGRQPQGDHAEAQLIGKLFHAIMDRKEKAKNQPDDVLPCICMVSAVTLMPCMHRDGLQTDELTFI